MTDREALAAAYSEWCRDVGKPSGLWPRHLLTIRKALDERLAQLPETCGRCDGNGLIDFERDEYGHQIGPQEEFCPSCHGSGRVYPAELVERIAALIADFYGGPKATSADLGSRTLSVAVLDALNGETP